MILLILLFLSAPLHAEFTPLPASTPESTNSNFKTIDEEIRRLDSIISSTASAMSGYGLLAGSNTWTGSTLFTTTVTIGPTVFTSTLTISSNCLVSGGIIEGGWTLVASTNPSLTDRVYLTGFAPNKKYQLRIQLTPTADDILEIVFNNDAGNNYFYQHDCAYHDGATSDRATGQTYGTLSCSAAGLEQKAAHALVTVVDVVPVNGTNAISVTQHGTQIDSKSNGAVGFTGSVVYEGARPIDTITLLTNAGTTWSGSVEVWAATSRLTP